MDKDTLAEQLKPFRLVAFSLIGLVIFSTVFFHLVEKWSWLNSYYYTVITVATVGYGDFTPKTDAGKIAATVLVFFGIGLFGIFANLLLKRRAFKVMSRRESKK